MIAANFFNIIEGLDLPNLNYQIEPGRFLQKKDMAVTLKKPFLISLNVMQKMSFLVLMKSVSDSVYILTSALCSPEGKWVSSGTGE